MRLQCYKCMLRRFNLCSTTSSLLSLPAESPCMTPEGVRGTCVNIQDCPQIALILQNAPRPLPAGVQTYILNLRCGAVNGKVSLPVNAQLTRHIIIQYTSSMHSSMVSAVDRPLQHQVTPPPAPRLPPPHLAMRRPIAISTSCHPTTAARYRLIK